MLGFGFGGLFTGFRMKDSEKQQKDENQLLDKNVIVEIDNIDAAQLVDNTYAITSHYNTLTNFSNQADIINEYRAMALHPEVDNAVDDIINASVSCEEDVDPVAVVLEDVELSDAIKDKIVEEFSDILEMMSFNETAYEKFKQWYVDGRQVVNVIVDESRLKEGIQKLVFLDSRAVQKVKEIKRSVDANTKVEKIVSVETYYVYDPTYTLTSKGQEESRSGQASSTNMRRAQQLRLSEDSVVMIHSGVLNPQGDMVLSNLEKARKALNNLRMIEDALVVYRITRAPERRVFYIDVGSLPKKAAEEYLTHVMNKYKTKMVYNSSSGKVEGNAHQLSMMEDFWLPRREGGRGTEIDTLQGGQNLGDIEDVLYFLKKLYKSLNVPASRLEQEATIALGGRASEITRDEWKFGKFVARLRRRYGELFKELLKRQLILKNIITQADWDEKISSKIKFQFASDTFMRDQQEADLLMDQINTLAAIDPFVGKYFSRQSVKRRVLKQTDSDMKEERKKIDEEIAAGEYPDPATVGADDQGGNPFGSGFGNPDAGQGGMDQGGEDDGQTVPAGVPLNQEDDNAK